MKLLILTHTEVEQLLPIHECIDLMAHALFSLARGEMYQPLRTIVRPSDVPGVMALMPAFQMGQHPIFGLKAICVFPGNAALGLDAHQGGVFLFDGSTGQPLSLMNASAITAIRTAAVSGVATRLLARDDAATLALIGAGVQARTHLAAMACIRSLKEARITARTLARAEALVAELQPQFSFPLRALASAQAAIEGADIIVTATTSRDPVVKREWVGTGTHINAVGTYSPKAREIDTATMADARLFVDRRESVLNEAGDYLIAAAEGAIGPDHIQGEIGELLTGIVPGRTNADEITIFKSLGLAIEDLAAASYLYNKAQRQNAGTWVTF